MSNDLERDILRQPGDLIKGAKLAHRWITYETAPSTALASSLTDQLDIETGFSPQKALASWNEIQLTDLRELRSPNTNHW